MNIVTETKREEISKMLQLSPEQKVMGNLPMVTPVLVTTVKEGHSIYSVEMSPLLPIVSLGQEVKGNVYSVKN